MTPIRPTAAVLATAACLAAGCGASNSEAVTITHSGPVLVGLTAQEVVTALEMRGTVVLHPIDTTSADCSAAGCVQAITTDRFRVMSFGTTGAAQKYAAERGLNQVETVVVAFSPPVPPDERSDIWRAVTAAVR